MNKNFLFVYDIYGSTISLVGVCVSVKNPKPPRERRNEGEAAYLFAILGENTTPSADDIEGILGAIGADCEDKRLELLLLEGNGKDKTKLFASRQGKLARMSSNGGVVVAATLQVVQKLPKLLLRPRKRRKWRTKNNLMTI